MIECKTLEITNETQVQEPKAAIELPGEFELSNQAKAPRAGNPADMVLKEPKPYSAEPVPEPLDDSNKTEDRADIKWVADLIGEDFKKWEPGLVAIEASTGTGKTSFILGPFMRWCADKPYMISPKPILYLTNRNSLRDEIDVKLKAMRDDYMYNDAEDGMCCLLDEMFDRMNYQYLETILKENPKYAQAILRRYKYIVCDEAHYFVDDATFNENTTLMYDALMERAKSAKVIFMTATPGFMYKSWLRQGKLKKERYYHLYRKADHITEAYVYRKELLKGILDKTPADTKSMIFVQKRNRLDTIKAWYGDQAACYCSKNNKYGAMDDLENCIRDEKLQKRFVAATEALYNGIDIKDNTVKSIFIEDYRPTKVIQELGRKRWQGETDTCTVYFREPSKKEIRGALIWVKYVGTVVEACWKLKNGKPDDWNKLLKTEKGNEHIETAIKKNYVQFDHATGQYNVNRMCVEKLREEYFMLLSICYLGYQQFMQREVWDKLLNMAPIEYEGLEIVRYINQHMGEKMAKEELQAGLAEVGLCDGKTAAEGLKTLNRKLEKYQVVIRRERKKLRIKGNSTTQTRWYLDRL